MNLPSEALLDWHTLKPSSFALFGLMCKVKDSRESDLYIDPSKAAEYKIGKTAYYEGLAELEKMEWIVYNGKRDGRKRWIPVKGFAAGAKELEKRKSANAENSANAEKPTDNDSANTENSANAEFSGENESVNAENSANAEKPSPQNSANAENPPPPLNRINSPKEDLELREKEKKAREKILFESFPETEKIPNEQFRLQICETLDWLIGDKQLTLDTFPAGDWLSVLLKLRPQNLAVGEDFKSYYRWVERRDFVKSAIKPGLLIQQLEDYKKRAEFSAKNQKGATKNAAGQTPNRKQGIHQPKRTDKEIFEQSAEFYRNFPD